MARPASVTQRAHPPRVIHLPAWNDWYQRSLLRELAEAGVSASLGVHSERWGFDFSVLASVKNLGRPQVLHLHWQHPFLVAKHRGEMLVRSMLFFFQLLILRMFGTKLVWTVHNIKNHENVNSGMEIILCRVLSRLVNVLIVHCECAKSQVASIYRLEDDLRRIEVIPHGTDDASISTIEERQLARRRFGCGETEFVFLYFGLIRSYKGVIDLIGAFSQVKFPGARLLVVGKCNDSDVVRHLQDAARQDSRVQLRLEFIEESEVAALMSVADAVVCPYTDILTSGSVSRAISHGRPVIAPRIGCIPEAVSDNEAWLYEPGVGGALLRAMNEAISCPLEVRRRMEMANRERSQSNAWRVVAAATESTYASILN